MTLNDLIRQWRATHTAPGADKYIEGFRAGRADAADELEDYLRAHTVIVDGITMWPTA